MKRGIFPLVASLGAFGIGFFLGGKMLVDMINDCITKKNRYFSNMMLFNNWLESIYSRGSIDNYFHNHGYRKIMIYGNGYVGARLFQALSGTDIEVTAVMDKAASSDSLSAEVIGINSEIPASDCIVVTPIFYYEEIYNMLSKKTDIPIISIQSVIEEACI